MLMNQILDSFNSQHRVDELSHPLKRSASVASLPTPPRTLHKRSRSRARSSVSQCDSDGDGSTSDLDDDSGRGYTSSMKRIKTIRHDKTETETDEHEGPDYKKRRTLDVLPGRDEDEEDENAFWTGRGDSSREKQGKKTTQTGTMEDGSPSPAMLRYRVKAPVSPPPSRRQPSIQLARAPSVEHDASLTRPVAPVTPPPKLFLRAPSTTAAEAFNTPAKLKATKIWPKRDSPNNPFLIESSQKVKAGSEWDSSDDEEVVGDALEREETPTPGYEEKPTITYVFRGQKATFHNPLYGLAPEVIAASKLPVDHPDYEAAEACPPKKLFSSVGKRKSRDRSRESNSVEGVKRTKVQPSEEDQDQPPGSEQRGTGTKPHKKTSWVDCAGAETKHVSLCVVDGAREERERKETAAKIRLGPRDGLRAGTVFADRDEPARRAMGPVRNA